MKSNINIFAAPTEQAGVMFKSRLVQVKVYTDNTTIYIYVVKNWTNIYCYWDWMLFKTFSSVVWSGCGRFVLHPLSVNVCPQCSNVDPRVGPSCTVIDHVVTLGPSRLWMWPAGWWCSWCRFWRVRQRLYCWPLVSLQERVMVLWCLPTVSWLKLLSKQGSHLCRPWGQVSGLRSPAMVKAILNS